MAARPRAAPVQERWHAGDVAREAALGLRVGVAAGGRGSVLLGRYVGAGAARRAQGEGYYARASSHVRLSQLPVHRLRCSPGHLHFFCHFCPHLWLESETLSVSPLGFLRVFVSRVCVSRVCATQPSEMPVSVVYCFRTNSKLDTGDGVEETPRESGTEGNESRQTARAQRCRQRRRKKTPAYLSYKRASLFLRSSSHSLRRSR